MDLTRLLCTLLLTACCCRRSAGVPSEVEPKPEILEFEVGDNAHLNCDSSLPIDNLSHVDWFFKHKDQRIHIFQVRRGQGQPDPGEYQHRLTLVDGANLSLAHVTPKDERIFICQVKGLTSNTQEKYIQLQIYKAPKEPTIQASTSGISVMNKVPQEVATCNGEDGYPIPHVTWYKNRRPLKEDKNRIRIMEVRTKESSGLYTVRSTLWAQLDKEDKEALFYCELSYRLPGGDHMKESKEVNVTVYYPMEKVWLEVMPNRLLKEGDKVELKCLSDGNPPPHFTIRKQDPTSLSWLEVENISDGVLILEQAQKHHSGLYECLGLDFDTGVEATDQQQLLVNYVSNIRVQPKAPVMSEGSSLKLNCSAESSQPVVFHWKREKTKEILKNGSVLHLTNLTREAGGGYLCVASVPGVPGLKRTQLVNVTINGSPWVMAKEAHMWVRENEMVNLTCEVSGQPRPTISWSVNGTIHEHKKDFQTILSTLKVQVTPELLEKGAVCQASNSLGSNKTTIFLELVNLTTLPVTTTGNTTSSPSTTTSSPSSAKANSTSTGDPVKKGTKQESKGVVIVVVIVCILLLAVLGAVLYFLYKKGKMPCGRSGKQEITLPLARKNEIVVEVKSDKLPEEMGLLQGSNGDKRAPRDQGEKYIDLRH
ncbi:cell surface glycoprotein MUC18 isoform X2 [Trichosurus vulpecula]|uniref:cell surface glycoprotein MUC18 isoform X2 n=1 Tax=Trichosurus vulpecula TaxID=9337 RepID=UPI00186B53DB|nr:cell surface glycoprotein MUC18 isoform X2 [Trichosurus vulpecula]